ncbi:hypothetical protein AC578_418 [Pseudocercospora eumusae]|uniref:Secreted protein n=1 Tax=Pseudocercospora eumusae TaxID=321146 RepID=A0A139HYA2_9PEZI|nr:hypothetical protein AC578_418 [Pseudocercospora eumusae]
MFAIAFSAMIPLMARFVWFTRCPAKSSIGFAYRKKGMAGNITSTVLTLPFELISFWNNIGSDDSSVLFGRSIRPVRT